MIVWCLLYCTFYLGIASGNVHNKGLQRSDVTSFLCFTFSDGPYLLEDTVVHEASKSMLLHLRKLTFSSISPLFYWVTASDLYSLHWVVPRRKVCWLCCYFDMKLSHATASKKMLVTQWCAIAYWCPYAELYCTLNTCIYIPSRPQKMNVVTNSSMPFQIRSELLSRGSFFFFFWATLQVIQYELTCALIQCRPKVYVLTTPPCWVILSHHFILLSLITLPLSVWNCVRQWDKDKEIKGLWRMVSLTYQREQGLGARENWKTAALWFTEQTYYFSSTPLCGWQEQSPFFLPHSAD